MKINCPICKNVNSSDDYFCGHCRYPINVKNINSLSKADLKLSLLDLSGVMDKVRKPLFKDKEVEQIYDELLSLNWLRPESAVVRFIEAEILFGFKKYLKYPVLDLGCGDGLFTSILFGGRINKMYDAYQSVDFSQKDVYNSYTKLPADFIETKPGKIGFGMDIKKNAMRKAKELNVYDEVRKGDVRKIPFDNELVNSVFSNMIDDINEKDLNSVFKQVHRVLKKGGHFVFTSPTERFREFLYYFNKGQKQRDRGRSAWQPRSLSLWKKIFKKTSFEEIEVVEYGDTLMMHLWDTGFRPFFYHLMGVRKMLKDSKCYLPLKTIFLEMAREYFLKYVKGQVSKKGAFRIIIARKI